MALPLVFTSNVRTYRNNGRFYDIPDACMATDDTNLQVVIKTFLGDGHERSFSVSQEPTALYFFRCLDKFHSQNDQGESITCYVYEKYTPLTQWTTIANNVAQNNSYSKNFLQILR